MTRFWCSIHASLVSILYREHESSIYKRCRRLTFQDSCFQVYWAQMQSHYRVFILHQYGGRWPFEFLVFEQYGCARCTISCWFWLCWPIFTTEGNLIHLLIVCNDVVIKLREFLIQPLYHLRAISFIGNIKNTFTIYVIPPHWHDTCSCNPFSCKPRTYLFYIINIMLDNVIATQWQSWYWPC